MESAEFDTFDAVIHLASDHPEVVLEAEEALFGEISDANGGGIEATLAGIFERESPRRTGFVEPGLPANHTDLDGVLDSIPEDAPFFMGFRSGFRESQAPEDRVTIHDGPFAGGSEERDPLADEESGDGPEIITPEGEERTTSESGQETEPAASEPEPEPENQTGFAGIVAIVALLAAIGLRRQIT